MKSEIWKIILLILVIGLGEQVYAARFRPSSKPFKTSYFSNSVRYIKSLPLSIQKNITKYGTHFFCGKIGTKSFLRFHPFLSWSRFTQWFKNKFNKNSVVIKEKNKENNQSSAITNLHEAILQKNFEQIDLLLNNDIDVNIQDKKGWTALHCAVFIGCNSLIERLVEKGANLEICDSCKLTPLMLASALGKSDLVKLLIKYGAIIDNTKALEKKYGSVENQSLADYLRKKFGDKTQTGEMLNVMNTDWKKCVNEQLVSLEKSNVKNQIVAKIDGMAEFEKKVSCAKSEKTDTHVMLYHRQPGLISFIHDVFYVLGGQKTSGIVPFRLGSNEFFEKAKSIDEFKGLLKNGLDSVHDHDELVRSALVSVNPSLFSNIHDLGESSLLQFLDVDQPYIGFAYNGSPNYLIADLLPKVFSHFGLSLNKDILKVAFDIYSRYYGDKSSLLQLAIPKEKISKYSYLARPFGRPVFTNDMLERPPKNTHSVDEFFELLKKNSEKLYQWIYKDKMLDMDEMVQQRLNLLICTQLRLYPHPSYFLDKNSGIQCVRHDYGLTPEMSKDRQEALVVWAHQLKKL